MLDNIRIASPCSADWEKMPGDDRVRHCHACNLNVYNFSAMTEREIRRLVAEREGRLCARLFQRADGTVLTQNCPVGLRALSRRLSRVAGAVLAFMLPGFTGMQQAFGQSYSSTNSGEAGLQAQVFDQMGARVPFATAILTETSRGIRREAKADKEGRLILRSPVAGRYTLTVSSTGFQANTQTVELRSGQVLSLPVTLLIGMLGEVVMVEPTSQPDKKSLPPAFAPAPARSTPKPIPH
jgi:hypothetical protein